MTAGQDKKRYTLVLPQELFAVSDERMWRLLSTAVYPRDGYYATADFDIKEPGRVIHHQAAAWPFPQMVIIRRPGRRPRLYVGRWRNF